MANFTFTENEGEQLKLIVLDWLNEGLQLPPFDADLLSVLGKLGIGEAHEDSPEIYPKTQEQLSRSIEK